MRLIKTFVCLTLKKKKSKNSEKKITPVYVGPKKNGKNQKKSGPILLEKSNIILKPSKTNSFKCSTGLDYYR